MKNAILNSVRQGIIDAKAHDTVTLNFINGNMHCHVLSSNDSYHVIYEEVSDRVIIAWALKLYVENNEIHGSWGNGYYYNRNDNADNTIDRYDLNNVVDLYINKGFKG